MPRPFLDRAVEQKFQSYPHAIRRPLMQLREMVFETAKSLEDCGDIIEALKWGQPSFLTQKPKSGSTIRMDASKECGNGIALYFHCQSGLIDEFRRHYSDVVTFENKRAILLNGDTPLPQNELRHCLALALTHHSRKRRRNS